MRVAVGSDEEGPLVDALLEKLRAEGHEPDLRSVGAEWPAVGRAVAEAVVSGEADLGVVCCFTGTGVSIAANKVPGARAALCADAATAAGARRWNDANVLALSLRLTSEVVLDEILDAFFSTVPDADTAATIAALDAAVRR